MEFCGSAEDGRGYLRHDTEAVSSRRGWPSNSHLNGQNSWILPHPHKHIIVSPSGQLSKARTGYQQCLHRAKQFWCSTSLGCIGEPNGKPESAIVLISQLSRQTRFCRSTNSLGNVYKEMKNWIKGGHKRLQSIGGRSSLKSRPRGAPTWGSKTPWPLMRL